MYEILSDYLGSSELYGGNVVMADWKHVSFHNWVLLGDYYYADNYVTNDIVVINKKTLKVVDNIEIHIEKYTYDWYHQYFINIAGYGDKLYLFPYFYKDYMVIVHLETKEIEYQKMSEKCGYDGFTALPQRYFKLEDKLIFLPDSIGDSAIIFNMSNDLFSREHIFPRDLINKYGTDSKISRYDIYTNETELWCSVGSLDHVLQINCKENIINEYNLEGRNGVETIFCPDERNIWYVNYMGNLCKLDRTSRKVTTFDIEDYQIRKWKIVALSDIVILLSNDINFPKSAKVFKFETDEIQNIESYMPDMKVVPDFRSSGGYSNYQGKDRYEDKILFFPNALDGMLLFDPATCDIKKNELIMGKEYDCYFERIRRECLFVNRIIREERDLGLKELIDGKLDKYF